MRKVLRIIILSLIIPVLSTAQSWEGGIMLGTCNYLGDIGNGSGPNRPFIYDLQINKTRPGIGGFLRYHATYRTGLRASIMYGQATGDDVLTVNPARKVRNLHFKSNVFEFSTQFEYAFYKSKHANYRDLNQTFKRTIVISEFTLYGFMGVGVFRFNPKARYNGDWVPLQPLGTEGQVGKEKYNLIQFNIPMGFGAHYHITDKLRVGIEVGYRKLFTDYLDDISGFYEEPLILAKNNPNNPLMAVELANRSINIFTDIDTIYHEPGFPRGQGAEDENDTYFFTVITFSYFLNISFPKGIDCPKYKSQRFLLIF